MSEWDTIVTGGTVVTEASTFEADVAIRGERIGAIGTDLGTADRTVDASGCFVVPGGVDPHVHVAMAGDPGMDPLIEDIREASMGALLGGTTTIACYLRTVEGQTLEETLDAQIEYGNTASSTDFAFNILCTPGDDMAENVRAGVSRGVTTFKAMLAYRTRGLMLEDRQLVELMDAVGRANGLLLVHAENGTVSEYLEEREQLAGSPGSDSYLRTSPATLEAEGTLRTVMLSRLSGCNVLFVHLTSREAAEAAKWIRQGPDAGRVWWETQPHYLMLTNDEVLRRGALGKVGPPLREHPDVVAVWEALGSGILSHVSSDHAPRNTELKLAAADILKAPYGGTTGTQVLLPLLYSAGYQAGVISIERFVELTSTNAAKRYGLYPRKGCIEPGADADLVVLPKHEVSRPIEPSALFGKSDYTLYEGITSTGSPRYVVRAGRVAVEQGTLVEAPPAKYLRRT